MGLPMYVSPSIPKRQLPSKQPTSPPYTPQPEESFEEALQNSRILNAFETQPELSQRSQRSRRSSYLPYNFVQQQIHRLHQLQLHRTREQQMTSNLASRRGLNSAHYLSLNHHTRIQHMQQMQAAAQARRQDRNLVSENSFETSRNNREERFYDPHDEIMDFPLDDFVTSYDNNNNNNSLRSNDGISFDGSGNSGNSNNNNNSNSNSNSNNNNNNNNNNNQTHNDNDNSNHSHHHRALDNVIRRVNLLRQISQQQERSMRPSSRHHRSSIGHSSSGRSRITSQNINVDRRREDLIQRGIDIPPSSTFRHSIPDSTLFYEHNSPFPHVPRLSAWHTRRGVNWSTIDPPPVQRTERRSSFADDFYSASEISHQYESDEHLSRILSPIPRRYDARLTALPIGNDLESDDNRSNVETEQRGSASGEVC